jgi:large-conductance mechanosensitive channel
MAILKFLFIVFAIFYIISLLGRYFLKRMVRNAQKQYQQNGQKDNRSKKRKEGETTVQYKPHEKKHIPNDEGDYVDYEEIK